MNILLLVGNWQACIGIDSSYWLNQVYHLIQFYPLLPHFFPLFLSSLSGVCSLGCVCCFLAGMDLLHRVSVIPDQVDGSLGWSLYLALISSPLYMMAAALLVWAARSHSKNYYRFTAYRVA